MRGRINKNIYLVVWMFLGIENWLMNVVCMGGERADWKKERCSGLRWIDCLVCMKHRLSEWINSFRIWMNEYIANNKLMERTKYVCSIIY